jgi:hypothetical protein
MNSKSEGVKTAPCSRWEEIVECIDYHIKLVVLIEAPTRFRSLNNPGANVFGPPQFFYYQRSRVRRARPGGFPPLTNHILEIRNKVFQMAPGLRRLGKKVVIVIATDGGPKNNRKFVEALRLLEGLPLLVLVRPCTDDDDVDDDVVEFYNDLDGQLKLSMEVYGSPLGEAKEVTGENPWLNYGFLDYTKIDVRI